MLTSGNRSRRQNRTIRLPLTTQKLFYAANSWPHGGWVHKHGPPSQWCRHPLQAGPVNDSAQAGSHAAAPLPPAAAAAAAAAAAVHSLYYATRTTCTACCLSTPAVIHTHWVYHPVNTVTKPIHAAATHPPQTARRQHTCAVQPCPAGTLSENVCKGLPTWPASSRGLGQHSAHGDSQTPTRLVTTPPVPPTSSLVGPHKCSLCIYHIYYICNVLYRRSSAASHSTRVCVAAGGSMRSCKTQQAQVTHGCRHQMRHCCSRQHSGVSSTAAILWIMTSLAVLIHTPALRDNSAHTAPTPTPAS